MLKTDGKQIYLACGQTDMRKSINGLSGLVQCSFQLEPCSQALFVFCNRNRNRLKILEWDGDGFWLHLKRLEGGRFKWPEEAEGEKTMTIELNELIHLLSSPRFEQKLRRKQIAEKLML